MQMLSWDAVIIGLVLQTDDLGSWDREVIATYVNIAKSFTNKWRWFYKVSFNFEFHLTFWWYEDQHLWVSTREIEYKDMVNHLYSYHKHSN